MVYAVRMSTRNFTDAELIDLTHERGKALVEGGYTAEWLAQVIRDDDTFAPEDREFYEFDADLGEVREGYMERALAAHPEHNNPNHLAVAMSDAIILLAADEAPDKV